LTELNHYPGLGSFDRTPVEEVLRESGVKINRTPSELFDNGFAENLEKSGLLKELWGNKLFSIVSAFESRASN